MIFVVATLSKVNCRRFAQHSLYISENEVVTKDASYHRGGLCMTAGDRWGRKLLIMLHLHSCPNVLLDLGRTSPPDLSLNSPSLCM